jgi:hypothetical protein
MRALCTVPARRSEGISTLNDIRPHPRPGTADGPRSVARFDRARRAAPALPPDTIEQIAQRVVQLLRVESQTIEGSPASGPELLNAAELARRFGLTRTWVYENAGRLGAIQLSDGPRPRLRFDPQVAAQALRRRNEPVPAIEPPRTAPARRRRTPTDVTLLPVYDPRSRAAFARRGPAHRASSRVVVNNLRRVLRLTDGRA